MSTDHINIHDPATYIAGVPHDQYTVLRNEAPVWFQREPPEQGKGYWAITKYDDIVSFKVKL